jgi:hypothetical protein
LQGHGFVQVGVRIFLDLERRLRGLQVVEGIQGEPRIECRLELVPEKPLVEDLKRLFIALCEDDRRVNESACVVGDLCERDSQLSIGLDPTARRLREGDRLFTAP